MSETRMAFRDGQITLGDVESSPAKITVKNNIGIKEFIPVKNQRVQVYFKKGDEVTVENAMIKGNEVKVFDENVFRLAGLITKEQFDRIVKTDNTKKPDKPEQPVLETDVKKEVK